MRVRSSKILHDDRDEQRHQDNVGDAQRLVVDERLDAIVEQADDLRLVDVDRDAVEHEAHAQRGDEGRDPELGVQHAGQQPGRPTDGDADRQYPQADIVGGEPALAQQPDEDRAKRDSSLEGKVDAADDDRQVQADGQDRRNGGQAEDDLDVRPGDVLALGAEGEHGEDECERNELRHDSGAAQPVSGALPQRTRRRFPRNGGVGDALHVFHGTAILPTAQKHGHQVGSGSRSGKLGGADGRPPAIGNQSAVTITSPGRPRPTSSRTGRTRASC